MLTSVLTAVLASIPGLYALASGRSLVRRLDDPIINELFFQRGRRLSQVAIVTMVLLAVANPTWAPGLIPLSILGLLVGSFPSRRLLFKESWSLAGFLRHTLRLTLAMYGPWLLFLFGLAAILLWESVAPVVGVGLVGVLTAWGVWGGPLMLRIFGAVPLDDPELTSAFDPLLAGATCPRPDLFVTKADGGHWANAFAVPRLNTGAVLFTAGLLEILDTDEAAGILAHELAHLEEFQGGRWLRRSLLPAAVGAGAVALLLIAQAFASWILWTVPVAILVTLVIVGGRSQKREADSDARAVELTGDPEGLVRALDKIHRRARMPRRVDAEMEKMLTHPSLARRIQAIRGDQASPEDEEAPATEAFDELQPLRVQVTTPRSTVIYLDSDRLHCFENVAEGADRSLDALVRTASLRSYPYGALRGLRVEVRGSKRFLTMRDGTSPKPTRFQIGSAEVGDIQAYLDRIDGLLGRPVGGARGGLHSHLARFAALLGVLVGMGLMYSGFAIACVLAVLVPRRELLVAAGVVGALTFLAAAFGIHGVGSVLGSVFGTQFGSMPWTSAPLALVALLLFGSALATGRGDGEATDEAPSTAALAGLGLVAVALIFAQLGSVPSSSLVIGLHLWARSAPDALLMLAGSGVGLLFLKRTLAKAGGGLAVLATVLVATTGLTFFRTTSRDLLSAAPVAVVATPVTAELVRTVVIEGDVSSIRVDRGTARLLVTLGPDPGQGGMDYQVETADGWRDVDADQAAWAASGDLVGLRVRDGVVFTEDAAGDVQMEMELPRLLSPALAVRGDVWTVTDADVETAVLRIHRGAVSSGAGGPTQVIGVPEDSPVMSLGVTDDAVAFATAKPEASLIPISIVGGWPYSWGLGVAVGADTTATVIPGRTVMDLNCLNGAGSVVFCVTHAGERSEIWSIDPHTQAIEPLGVLPGWFWAESASDGIVLDNYADAPLWISGDRRIVELPLEGYSADGLVPQRWRQTLDVSGEWLAVAWSEGGRSSVELWRLALPDADGPSQR